MIRKHFLLNSKRSTPFGLLSLHGTSSIRGLGFSPEIYAPILDSIKMGWPVGIEYATNNEGDSWRCVLNGSPWKKEGKEELECVSSVLLLSLSNDFTVRRAFLHTRSIRLILAILTTIATHGWTLKDEIQVGSSKKDTHSFVFSYKERNQDEAEEVPDFFALTFPCKYEFGDTVFDEPDILR